MDPQQQQQQQSYTPPVAASAAAPTKSNGVVDSARLGQNEGSRIGWAFISQYYTYLNRDPSRLHCFYTKRSTFIHGTEGAETSPCYGQVEIHEKIMSLGFEDCKVYISNVDCQTSAEGGIIVQVIGELSNRGARWRKFVQTFFLAEQTAGFFVLNDVRRFIKDEADEDEEEEDHAVTAAVREEMAMGGAAAGGRKSPSNSSESSVEISLSSPSVNSDAKRPTTAEPSSTPATLSSPRSSAAAAPKNAKVVVAPAAALRPPPPPSAVNPAGVETLSISPIAAVTPAPLAAAPGASAPSGISTSSIPPSAKSTAPSPSAASAAATPSTSTAASSPTSAPIVSSSPATSSSSPTAAAAATSLDRRAGPPTAPTSSNRQQAPLSPSTSASVGNPKSVPSPSASSPAHPLPSTSSTKSSVSPPAGSPVATPIAPAPAPQTPQTPQSWANLAANNSVKWGSKAVNSKGVLSASGPPTASTSAAVPVVGVASALPPRPVFASSVAAIGSPSCFVKGVVETVNEKQLRDVIIARFGPIRELSIIRSKACAFLEFEKVDGARRAIQASLRTLEGGEGGLEILNAEGHIDLLHIVTKKPGGERATATSSASTRGSRGGGEMGAGLNRSNTGGGSAGSNVNNSNDNRPPPSSQQASSPSTNKPLPSANGNLAATSTSTPASEDLVVVVNKKKKNKNKTSNGNSSAPKQ